MSKCILALALLSPLLMSSTAGAQEDKPTTILFGGKIEQPIERSITVVVKDRASAVRRVRVLCVWDKVYVAIEGEFFALNAAARQGVSSTRFLSGGETFGVSGDPPVFVRERPSLSRLCPS
jgi:hypothetical protein